MNDYSRSDPGLEWVVDELDKLGVSGAIAKRFDLHDKVGVCIERFKDGQRHRNAVRLGSDDVSAIPKAAKSLIAWIRELEGQR